MKKKNKLYALVRINVVDPEDTHFFDFIELDAVEFSMREECDSILHHRWLKIEVEYEED